MKAGHEYTGRNLSGSPVARGYTQGQLEVSTWWSYCIPPDIARFHQILPHCKIWFYIHLNTVYLCTALYFNVRMNKDIIYICPFKLYV